MHTSLLIPSVLSLSYIFNVLHHAAYVLDLLLLETAAQSALHRYLHVDQSWKVSADVYCTLLVAVIFAGVVLVLWYCGLDGIVWQYLGHSSC